MNRPPLGQLAAYNPFSDFERQARRRFLRRGTTTLSAGAIALLVGSPALAAQAGATTDPQADTRILNTALGAELEAIAAYSVGAASGLLQPAVRQLAVQFQGHHREHAELLAKTVRQLGGQAVEPKASYRFPTEQLQNQQDVLAFAAGLERGAVSAYLGAVPIFADRELAKAAASILGDEAMHWAILRQAIGENPVPSAFVS